LWSLITGRWTNSISIANPNARFREGQRRRRYVCRMANSLRLRAIKASFAESRFEQERRRPIRPSHPRRPKWSCSRPMLHHDGEDLRLGSKAGDAGKPCDLACWLLAYFRPFASCVSELDGWLRDHCLGLAPQLVRHCGFFAATPTQDRGAPALEPRDYARSVPLGA